MCACLCSLAALFFASHESASWHCLELIQSWMEANINNLVPSMGCSFPHSRPSKDTTLNTAIHKEVTDRHTKILTTVLSLDPTPDWYLDLNPDWSLTQQKEPSVEWEDGGLTSAFQAIRPRQTASEPVVSVTSQWTTEERYKWGVEEEPGLPGWGLLQLETEGAPARERSTEGMAGSCHLCCSAERLETDQLAEQVEEVKGQRWSQQGISDQNLEEKRHYRSDTTRHEFYLNCILSYSPRQIKGSSKMSSMDCGGSICGQRKEMYFIKGSFTNLFFSIYRQEPALSG